jgi:AcrR family transcriptional regulator
MFLTNGVRCSNVRAMKEPIARKKVISRRSRPAKSPLSHALIVSTALAILAREGVAGLSLRRVASSLDTGAASLYVYVDNLEGLHAHMIDAALTGVRAPKSKTAHWRKRLKSLLLAYLRALHRYHGLAQLAMSTIACGPNSLRIWDSLLGLLIEGGVGDTRAAWGVDLLILYVTATAAEHGPEPSNGQGLERVKRALATARESDYSHVFAFRDALTSGDGEARANWALEVMIDGILSAKAPRLRSPNVTSSTRMS